jgi:hypothetical protein
MTDTVISVRIDKQVRERMRELDHINWSAIIRRALIQYIAQEQEKKFDMEKVKRACERIDKIRASGVFDEGKSSVEIIREWRNKRRF